MVPEPVATGERPATGREKHDHKITVYLSAEELLDLEHARLALRRLGLAIDRGRLVREAIAVLLADLDARGTDSLLARRIGLGAAETAGGSLPAAEAVPPAARRSGDALIGSRMDAPSPVNRHGFLVDGSRADHDSPEGESQAVK